MLRTEKGETASRLVREARRLVRTVLDSAQKTGEVNSIGFCSLPIPPCMAWNYGSHSPEAQAGNFIRSLKILMLKLYNDGIQELNVQTRDETGVDVVRAPSFKSWGMKKREEGRTITAR